MAKISVILGTRPEAIKLCPLVIMLKEQGNHEVEVCISGQHKEMLYQVLDVFKVKPDVNLDLMETNQTLVSLNSKALLEVDKYLKVSKPDLVIVQGDTTTVFSAALAAFYNNILVGHVEAGLRTYQKFSPFPEEINRVLTTHLSDLHFAPTETSRINLVNENVKPEAIHVTGNTVIDSLFWVKKKLEKSELGISDSVIKLKNQQKVVLITAHRRENFGEGIINICEAIVQLANTFSNFTFVYPVHLNPNIKEPVNKLLKGLKNVFLIEPLDYVSFIALMQMSYLILTDSGGVQEEAPSLGKPVLVMRDNSERPEAVEAGTVKLIGSEVDDIVNNVTNLLTNEDEYIEMARAINPYGDGNACSRICEIINNSFLK